MDIKLIKQLVDLMHRSDLTEFEIEEEGLRLRIARGQSGGMNVVGTPVATPYLLPPANQTPASPAAPVASPKEEGRVIRSPMVGTFYAAPAPDSPPFVSVGDVLKPESTVCIIEAMKVMNEIKAELSGTVVEVLVQNGDSVEYGQPLIRVK